MGPRIVLDTNVLVSGLRSRNGASFRILSLIGSGRSSVCLSVPLVLEHEAAARRQVKVSGLSATAVRDIIDYICKAGQHFKIYYLWRPLLRDPKDDMVLELAVSSNADAILTYNKAHFGAAKQFGITWYRRIRELCLDAHTDRLAYCVGSGGLATGRELDRLGEEQNRICAAVIVSA
jgi:putative PIN family toxin of toxin-antitoxin system